MKAYRVVMDLDAVRLWEALPRGERRRLIEFLLDLRVHPFQAGDLQERDETGRANEVTLVDELLVHFWVDHADATIRVTQLERT